MHTKSMSESTGDFTRTEFTNHPHNGCGGRVKVELWESHCGGYEDEKFTCERCGKVWWVEGPDS